MTDTSDPEVAGRGINSDTCPRICDISCRLLQRGLGRVTEITTDKLQRVMNAAARVISNTEVRQRLDSSAARRAALARRHRPGALQVGSTGQGIF